MEPTIKDLNIKKTLLHPKTVDGIEITEINIEKLIFRPLMKRIVFITKEFDRVIVYNDETTPGSFDAHKDDSNDTLIDALLAKIDADF